MTSNATPWVHVGDGPPGEFFDEPHFLRPGDLARWNREQLAIRAEEQRKQAEAQERSDAA